MTLYCKPSQGLIKNFFINSVIVTNYRVHLKQSSQAVAILFPEIECRIVIIYCLVSLRVYVELSH